MKNKQLTKNLLICGDNLKALDDLKKQGIKADWGLTDIMRKLSLQTEGEFKKSLNEEDKYYVGEKN